MINFLSNRIATWLALHSDTPKAMENIDVYTYGLECFLNTAITTVLLLLFALLNHSVIGICIWLLTFTTLRNHMGGFHARTHFACIACSTLMGISTIYFATATILSEKLFIILVYSIGLLFAFLKVPIKNEKKPLTALQQKKERNISYALLLLALLLSLMLPSPYSHFVTLSTFDKLLLAFVTLL